jgi:quercetin dioxygenase-like cupin family protein
MPAMTAPITLEPDSGAPPDASPSRARSIKRRLMDRVADADDSHLTIAAEEGDWKAFSKGVRIKVLNQRSGVLSYLLQMEPGATLPPHRHPMDEECIVLDGILQVGTRIEVGRGGYHLAHEGALHATVGTRSGATIFLRGAVPVTDDVLA